jgi:hypothetical protein
VKSFFEKKSVIFWYGTIYYVDVFDVERTSQFCRVFAADLYSQNGSANCHNHRNET